MLDFDLGLFLVDMDMKEASSTTRYLTYYSLEKRKNKVTPPQSL